MIHQQYIFRGPLDRRSDTVAVLLAENERLEDQQIESALQKLDAVLVGHSRRQTTRVLGDCLLESLPKGRFGLAIFFGLDACAVELLEESLADQPVNGGIVDHRAEIEFL